MQQKADNLGLPVLHNLLCLLKQAETVMQSDQKSPLLQCYSLQHTKLPQLLLNSQVYCLEIAKINTGSK